MSQKLREIPPVDRLVAQVEADLADVPRVLLVEAVRQVIEGLRRDLLAGGGPPEPLAGWFAGAGFLDALSRRLESLCRPRHRGVINGTGILLHTGLGRAPLCDAALRAVEGIGRHGLVEVDPDTGLRGRRELFVRDLLCQMTGAEEATVVNNNAAAVLLMLRGLAKDRQVIVSRGELVEIGGGFRVPAVMEESGATLVEVGTTNRTRLRDYADATGPLTALYLWVHTSNFRVVGFTETPDFRELVQLARERGVLAGADLGSGYLRPFEGLPVHDEPSVEEALADGFDVISFSGDKMLGGPQCGILLGRAEVILRLRREPLFRAVRPDKMTLAALEATLLEWRAAGAEPPRNIPFYRALTWSQEDLEVRGRRILEQVGADRLELTPSRAQVGSGSVPGRDFPSLALSFPVAGGEAEGAASRARRHDPPIFCRVQEGRLWLDLRTITPEEDAAVVDWLKTLPLLFS